jgi:hypothetical protein
MKILNFLLILKNLEIRIINLLFANLIINKITIIYQIFKLHNNNKIFNKVIILINPNKIIK